MVVLKKLKLKTKTPAINTQVKGKKAKAPADIEEVNLEEDDGVEEVAVEELDPEILAALNAKKKKKAAPKHHKEIDYIPELERDDNDFDATLGSSGF